MAEDATRLLSPRRGARTCEARVRALADTQFDLVVGGLATQHVTLLAEVLAAAARLEGYAVQYWVDQAEGRQHGGVRAHIRVGPAPSPKVARGGARLLVALETGEAERLRPYLAPGGAAVVSTFAWPTIDAKLGRVSYPDAAAVVKALEPTAGRALALDLARLAAEGAAPEPAPRGGEALAALGAITALTHVVDRESVVRMIRERFAEEADAAVEACLAGHRAVAGEE